MCAVIQTSCNFEHPGIPVACVVDESLSVGLDVPAWWSRVISSIEESDKLLIIREENLCFMAPFGLPRNRLVRLVFSAGTVFSLTTIQPEQCFSASFS